MMLALFLLFTSAHAATYNLTADYQVIVYKDSGRLGCVEDKSLSVDFPGPLTLIVNPSSVNAAFREVEMRGGGKRVTFLTTKTGADWLVYKWTHPDDYSRRFSVSPNFKCTDPEYEPYLAAKYSIAGVPAAD